MLYVRYICGYRRSRLSALCLHFVRISLRLLEGGTWGKCGALKPLTQVVEAPANIQKFLERTRREVFKRHLKTFLFEQVSSWMGAFSCLSESTF